MKGKFKTGRKFLKSSEFRLDFFKSGVIRAVLRAVSREQFTRSVMTGRRTGRHPVRTEAGTGSNEQDLTLHDLQKTKFGEVAARLNRPQIPTEQVSPKQKCQIKKWPCVGQRT